MSRQEGGWCVHRCVFLLKRMTRRLRRESGAYHFNGPLVNLLRQATQRGAGDEWKATCLCRCTPTLPEGNPLRGIDAPTTARTVGLPPRRGKYFLSVRKKVPKKASGTATPEAARPAVRRGLRSAGALRAVLDLGSLRSPAGKKASIAHFAGGAHNVARNGVRQLPPSLGARSCSPISAVKMEGPFSLRCLSPLCPGAAGVKQAQPTQVGMLHCSLDNFAAQKTVLFFSSAVGTIHT